jgi:hypothetical protein
MHLKIALSNVANIATVAQLISDDADVSIPLGIYESDKQALKAIITLADLIKLEAYNRLLQIDGAWLTEQIKGRQGAGP